MMQWYINQVSQVLQNVHMQAAEWGRGGGHMTLTTQQLGESGGVIPLIILCSEIASEAIFGPNLLQLRQEHCSSTNS